MNDTVIHGPIWGVFSSFLAAEIACVWYQNVLLYMIYLLDMTTIQSIPVYPLQEISNIGSHHIRVLRHVCRFQKGHVINNGSDSRKWVL